MTKRAAFDITVNTSAMFQWLFGPSKMSPFSNSEEIRKVIESDQWQTLLQSREADNIVNVVLNCDTMANPFKHKYIIKYDSTIPANCIMTVIFPTHPIEKRRLLWTSGNLKDLSLEMNARLNESDKQLVITSGNKFYRFSGIVGTCYLVWAERINQQTLNRQDNLIAEHVPIFIEMNRQWGYRNIFIFGNTEITKLEDVQALDPFQCPIFCCETDPRKEHVRMVTTMTNSQADQITKDLVVRSLVSPSFESEPFSTEEILMTPISGRFTNFDYSGNPDDPDEH